MKDVTANKAAMEAIGRAAQTLDDHLSASKREIIKREGYAEGLAQAAKMAHEYSMKVIEDLYDKSEVSDEERVVLKKCIADLASKQERHANDVTRNLSVLRAQVQGQEKSLTIVLKHFQKEELALKARMASPGLEQKLRGRDETLEKFDKAREERGAQKVVSLHPEIDKRVERLAQKKQIELQQISRNLGLAISGTKADLAKRIVEHQLGEAEAG